MKRIFLFLLLPLLIIVLAVTWIISGEGYLEWLRSEDAHSDEQEVVRERGEVPADVLSRILKPSEQEDARAAFSSPMVERINYRMGRRSPVAIMSDVDWEERTLTISSVNPSVSSSSEPYPLYTISYDRGARPPRGIRMRDRVNASDEDELTFIQRGIDLRSDQPVSLVHTLNVETGGLGVYNIPVATEVAVREFHEENPDYVEDKWGISVGTDPEDIFDAYVDEYEIVFLARSCAEGGYCYLGIYDRRTGLSRLISDDILPTYGVKFGGFSITSYDRASGKIELRVAGGDGPGVWVKEYEVNADANIKGDRPLIEIADYGMNVQDSCEDQVEMGYLSPGSLSECKEAVEHLSAWQEETISCGDFSFTKRYQYEYEGLIRTPKDGASGGPPSLIPTEGSQAEIVGCMEAL